MPREEELFDALAAQDYVGAEEIIAGIEAAGERFEEDSSNNLSVSLVMAASAWENEESEIFPEILARCKKGELEKMELWSGLANTRCHRAISYLREQELLNINHVLRTGAKTLFAGMAEHADGTNRKDLALIYDLLATKSVRGIEGVLSEVVASGLHSGYIRVTSLCYETDPAGPINIVTGLPKSFHKIFGNRVLMEEIVANDPDLNAKREEIFAAIEERYGVSAEKEVSAEPVIAGGEEVPTAPSGLGSGLGSGLVLASSPPPRLPPMTGSQKRGRIYQTGTLSPETSATPAAERIDLTLSPFFAAAQQPETPVIERTPPPLPPIVAAAPQPELGIQVTGSRNLCRRIMSRLGL